MHNQLCHSQPRLHFSHCFRLVRGLLSYRRLIFGALLDSIYCEEDTPPGYFAHWFSGNHAKSRLSGKQFSNRNEGPREGDDLPRTGGPSIGNTCKHHEQYQANCTHNASMSFSRSGFLHRLPSGRSSNYSPMSFLSSFVHTVCSFSANGPRQSLELRQADPNGGSTWMRAPPPSFP